jgi:hypothetical protein
MRYNVYVVRKGESILYSHGYDELATAVAATRDIDCWPNDIVIVQGEDGSRPYEAIITASKEVTYGQ